MGGAVLHERRGQVEQGDWRVLLAEGAQLDPWSFWKLSVRTSGMDSRPAFLVGVEYWLGDTEGIVFGGGPRGFGRRSPLAESGL